MDGRLVDDQGTLAGADLSMITAVRNAHELLNVPREAAFAMAGANPADFLSLPGHGRIAPGAAASLLAITDGWRIDRRWIDGRDA